MCFKKMYKLTLMNLIRDGSQERRYQSNIVTIVVNKLLKSKILLDEDEEIINTYVELIAVNEKNIKKSYKEHCKFINNVYSKLKFFTEITGKDILISAVCALPPALMEIQSYRVWYKFKNYGKGIEDLITLSNDNLLLIIQIEKYFQERELFLLQYKTKIDNDDLYNIVEAPEQKFKSCVVKRIYKTVLALQEEIRENVIKHGKDIEMYDTVLSVELSNLMTASADAFAECIKEMKYLYILLMSNFWGSFVLRIILNINEPSEFYKAMDSSIKIRSILKVNYDDIKNNYNEVRKVQSSNGKQERSKRSVSNQANIVRMKKIHEVQLFFKTGSDMAHTLEDFITDREKFELQITFLIDHLKKSSVQLNALEYIKPRNATNKVPEDITPKKVNAPIEDEGKERETKLIRYDQPESEGSDEEYECIVTDEDPHQVVNVEDYEDHVQRKSDYAQMMQELGAALEMVREKRAAKKGVSVPIAAPRTNVIKNTEEPVPAPRTSISVVERSFIEPELDENITESIVVENTQDIQVENIPAEIEDDNMSEFNTSIFAPGLSFAQQVAMEARKRNMVEEQFGCSGDDGDQELYEEEDFNSLVIISKKDPSES